VSARLLLVEDERPLVRTLSYALERKEFEVDVATDGRAAVEAALSQAYDLILLDVMLPKLSGTDACREIRAASDVPIIMVTARDGEQEVVEGLDVGADDYITKPFSIAELVGRVRSLLRRRELDRAANESMVRTVGGVTVDYLNDRVTVDGRLALLTPSEFKILALLASAPGMAWSRRQILRQLWGSTHGDEHTCEVHISALRRKIETDPSAPRRLVTVRGTGYMLLPS